MCNSLFPIRAASFAIQLSLIPEVVEAYNKDCSRMVLGADDGLSRMVLSSPGFGNAVRKHYDMKDFRARLAFTEGRGRFGISIPLLEMYSVEGTLIKATPVSDLPTELSDAICIEIQHVLLKSKGIDVNMY